jgi:Tfp pilus assembly PilM family ATPase
MARSFPPDVLVLDSDALIHARMGKGRKDVNITHAKSYRLAANTFSTSVVTPELTNEAGLADAIRRMRVESGRWDKASLLLADSWFRINILELQALPEPREEAEHIVRWSLKRTLPIEQEKLRVAFEILSRTSTQVRVLAVSAVTATLTAIERVFAEAGIELVLIEPAGLNLWNAITVREAQTSRDRILFYVRDTEFTTAAFRGEQPVFIRSRNLNADRTIEQEIRLSASYLRETLRADAIEHCYLAGNRVDTSLAGTIGNEFNAEVKIVSVLDVAEQAPSGTGFDAELAACTGVFV